MGKSSVGGYLRRQGIPVIDADKIARAIVKKGYPAYRLIVAHFGQSVCFKDGRINRCDLGKLVFKSTKERTFLESVTHPRISAIIFNRVRKLSSQNTIIAIEAPLLFETNLYQRVDEAWLVWTRDSIAIKRITQRDGRSTTEIKAVLKAQLKTASKMKMAHRVFDNNGSRESLYKKIDQALRDLRLNYRLPPLKNTPQ